MLKLPVVCLLFLNFSNQVCCEICSNSVDGFEKHLGSKTPYRVVANNTFGKQEYKGCEPEKIWMLVRHGTRTPSSKAISRMQTRLVEIKDAILKNNPTATDYVSNAELDLFRKWENKLKVEQQKKLTHEGEDEMVGIAERMQAKFPNVFDKAYSNTSYQFKYTDSQRTRQSAKYFTIGLFGKSNVKDVWYPEPLKRDPILRFYKLCNKWRADIKKNPAGIVERRKFENSPAAKELVTEIANQLGLGDENLTFGDVHLMYMTCAFETAWNRRRKSAWCPIFTIKQLKILEYAEDLKYYWIDGYGHELTYKQACPAFNDVMNLFKSKSNYPKAIVYFSHSGTILKMLAHLGLYRESVPLTADNYKDHLEDRKWRVSAIDAFGSNIAFVFHKCGDQQKILTLHQEQVVRLPACPDSDLCDLKDINQYYKDSIEKCNFDEICQNEI